ncbi:HesA/MoeB/ThiF family protein [Diaminobutyricibacter sp. McL0608]|uniref:HesA/MoeB/ThiF family protein n=1 Tax=Leifsonia sp. McL0608 TaxID=3143537 RepID=UPI0031F30FC0
MIIAASTYSVAMPKTIDDELRTHLIREDRQEDVCLASYSISSGAKRSSALIRRLYLPEPGERHVHQNASFTSDYIFRVVQDAAARGEGLVMLHSHPAGRVWQKLSLVDSETESGYAGIATTATRMPMIGMTLAGETGAWSARAWLSRTETADCESVRVVGDTIKTTFNPELRPAPVETQAQRRTISAWGSETQANIARTRVLVVGAGSVGLDVAQRLVASGIETVGVMDFDAVEERNLDRMIGATRADALLGRSKVEVARRLLTSQATAARPDIWTHDVSICSPAGLAHALDYDIIFSCVDRPWPRAVLNELAYSDLIPVIDGGINIESDEIAGLSRATARAHTLTPGRPCMVCIRQLNPSMVQLDKEGLLNDPEYIRRSGIDLDRAGQNVATMSATVSALLLDQFVSLTAAPGGTGVPTPRCFHFRHHFLEHLNEEQTQPGCRWEKYPGEGDARLALAIGHPMADALIASRRRVARTPRQWLALVRDHVGRVILPK